MIRKANGPRSPKRSRARIKRAIRDAFSRELPEDTIIDVSDGYGDCIHVMVISRRFDQMSEKAKQNLMWRVIDSSDLSEEEKARISLVYPVSPAAIKSGVFGA